MTSTTLTPIFGTSELEATLRIVPVHQRLRLVAVAVVVLLGIVVGSSLRASTAGAISGAVTVDDVDSGFQWGGPIIQCPGAGNNSRAYTRCWEDSGGYNGHYWYTWNCQTQPACAQGGDVNSGTWRPTIPYTASYNVCVYWPPDHAFTHDARYAIHAANGTFIVAADQASIAFGWHSLGLFSFNAGNAGFVYLGDNTGEADASTQIGFDAMQFVLDGGACGSALLPPDADLDRVQDSLDNCPTTPNTDQTNTDGNNTALGLPGQDAIGDACDSDVSGDGYGTTTKLALGKTATNYCRIMRADVNMDHVVNLLDLSIVASQYGGSIPPTNERLNQNADARINLLDLSIVAAVFKGNVSACP
jgi:hypothetical protein